MINFIDTNAIKYKTRYADYLMTKKALLEFTKMAAVQWGPHIRVNGISPGMILTPVNNQPDDRIKTDGDFRGRKVATPQLGNTQDVAARAWLASKGFRVTMTGGDVLVVPTANPDQLAMFQKGDLDAVWTVEPWVTRLALEAKGRVYLEEGALWSQTGGRYVTTHLVSSVRFLKQQPALLKRWIAAHVELTQWINQHADEAKQILNAEIKAETTKALPRETLDGAWRRLELTHDPVRASLLKSAEDAHRAGLLREKPDLSRIYDLKLLNEVLRDKGLAEIP